MRTEDRGLRFLLLVIALGIWAHLLLPLVRPSTAIAGDRVQVEIVNEVKVSGTVRLDSSGGAMDVEVRPEFGSRPLEVRVVN